MVDDLTILQLARRSIYPPKNGRQRRVWEESKALAKHGTVRLATPQAPVDYPEQSIRHLSIDTVFINNKYSMIYAWNIAHVLGRFNLYRQILSDRLISLVNKHDATFDLIIGDSPQVHTAAVELADSHDAPLLLNKHNSSFKILDDFLASSPLPAVVRHRAVRSLRALEQDTIDSADAVVFQSEADRDAFSIPPGTIVEVIPNGTNYDEITSRGGPERLRRELQLPEDRLVCVFVGSYDYFPNKEAARIISDEIAPELPECEFLLIGEYPPDTDRENVHTPGYVEDLAGVFTLSDIALCPIYSGAGTKLKLLDYLAAGLPIVTTETGASGINVQDGRTALVRETPSEFVQAIQQLRGSPDVRKTLSVNARALGKEYSWDSLLADYDEIVTRLVDGPRPRSRV